MPEVYDFDMKGLTEVQREAVEVKRVAEERQTEWEAIKEMVFMKWSSPTDKTVKLTVSPGPRNKVIGLRNLLASTSPQFNVPRDKNDPDADRVSSMLEHAAGVMWNASNRVQGKRTEADMVVSAAIYDEIHIDVLSTYDKVEAMQETWRAAKKADNYNKKFDDPRWESRIKKAKDHAARTPYLFRVANPETIYPIWSDEGEGLIARYKELDMYVADVRNKYGKRALEALSHIEKNDYEKVTICEWVDGAYRFTWLSEASTMPIFAETHGLDFMPFVAYRVSGTDMFSETEYTNEPFLYGVNASGIWQAQNTILTATRTAMNAIGLNAQMYYKKAHSEDTLEPIDHNIMAGVIEGQGELRSMMNDIVTKDIQQFWGMLEGMFEESTIYGSALGEKLSGNSTFSETALLAQQGRLPIVPIKTAMEESAGAAMGIACQWVKTGGKKGDVFGELGRGEIPAIVEFEVTVEPDLPTDKVQAGNVAASLMKAGVVSKEFAREMLGEGQSDEMQTQIWTEQMSDLAFQQGAERMLQEVMAEAEQMKQLVQDATQGMQPPPAGQNVPPTPPQQPPQGMPPQGMPPMGPPPQQGGGVPPQGMPPQGSPQQGQIAQPRPMVEEPPEEPPQPRRQRGGMI